MIRKSSVVGMVLLLVIALLMISTLFNPSGNRITGLLVLDSQSKLDELESVYSLIPIFETSADYSLKEYDEIAAAAKTLLDECKSNDEKAVEKCVDTKLPTNQAWTIAERSGFFYKFEVKSRYKLPTYDDSTQKLEDKEIIYRFALDFSANP